MKRVAVAFAAFALVVAAFSPASAQDAAAAVAKADEAWKGRDDLAAVKNSITGLEEAFKKEEKNYDLAWRIARAYFWLADQTDDKKLKADWGKTGMQIGQQASSLAPDKVEGYFYTAVSVGMFSEAIGIMKGLKEGLKKKFDAALDKALELDKNYEGAGPIRTKGRSYYKLPGIAGGSNKKAIQWLDDALKVDPTRLRTKYYKAVVYWDNGGKDKELAKALIDEILKTDPKAGDYPDNIAAQRWTRELQKKMASE
jgi:hypothetical protein